MCAASIGCRCRAMPILNHLGPTAAAGFFWTGQTDMRTLSVTIRQTLENTYAHHIQRLMVTGNFTLLARLAPPGDKLVSGGLCRCV